MTKQVLHISNGGSLTKRLKELDFEGEILTWQEMLCEGPTTYEIETEEFFKLRKQYLAKTYDIEVDRTAYEHEVNKLNNPEQYSEIILWFEYDLFCHINLLAVMALLHQRKIELPLYLVCSGRIHGESDLKGLSELSSNQLMTHYNKRVLLNKDDKALAKTLWSIYNGKDHNLFKPYIVSPSSFDYMGSCLKAHLTRFPDSKTGLGVLETNILEIIRDNDIKSRHHLLGYALNYQGYYGYGDIQFGRIINNLSIFFDENDQAIKLNRQGHEALLGTHNVSKEINNNCVYGGVNRLDYQFCKQHNKLIKRI